MTVEQLKSASQISQRMIRQAMQEAQTDPRQMDALQTVLDSKCATDFESPELHKKALQFLRDFNCDRMDLRPNTTNAVPRPPVIHEARITKVVIQPVNLRPPAPVGGYRDPLNLSGTGEAGATVEFFNASRPGRPSLNTTTIAADGSWSFELTDEALFKFGDQIGVRIVDANGAKSKPRIVPTVPFLVTQQVNAADHSQVISVTHQAMPRNTDNEKPFYQDNLVEKKTTAPSQVGEPWLLTLTGGDDAVEPNSLLRVVVNGETFETKSDDNGMFSLKVSGFTPGQIIKLEVHDLNGNRSDDVMYRTDPVRLDMATIAAGVSMPPTVDVPRGVRDVVGTSGPYLPFKMDGATEANGALIVFNRTTGETVEVRADEHGNINAAVGGMGRFDVLEIATRDVNGNISPQTEWAVVLPEKLRGQKGYLAPVNSLDKQSTADVQKVIESITGPPLDHMLADGKPDPDGPFLRMPHVDGMPPFGQLAVVRDGEVVQTLRADKEGCLQGLLAGVHVGDQLNFRVLDAAGRRFAGEYIGWNVPDVNKTGKVAGQKWTSDDVNLWDAMQMIGKGQLTLEHPWVQPFSIVASGAGPLKANVKLHYPYETFGGPGQKQEDADQINLVPQGIAKMFRVSSHEPLEVRIVEQNGTQRFEVNRMQRDQRNGLARSQMAVFGIDVVTGQLNHGDPNQPVRMNDAGWRTSALQQLDQLLRHSLAFVATAYDQGKEPGDLAYDKPMQLAKTTLYALDRLAKDFPDANDAIQKIVKEAVPDTGFPFELISKLRVPHQTADSSAPVSATNRSSALSLLDAVQKMKSGAEIDGGGDGQMLPPRVESAIILMPVQGQAADHPLRVRGRAKPGEIVQIFNLATAGRVLLAETIAGPDGRFSVIANAKDLQLGDALGIASIAKGGKQSNVRLVHTDGYRHPGDVTRAAPTDEKTRPPFVQTTLFKMTNASHDKDGKVVENGPRWAITSEDLGVRPLAMVKISSTTPEGKSVEVETQADEKGRFSLEFQGMGHSDFRFTAFDPGGQQTTVTLRTPGLAQAAEVRGDQLNELASGAVTFHLAGGDVKGVVVDQNYQQSWTNNTAENPSRIPDRDRDPNFVDVVLVCDYRTSYKQGQSKDENFTVRVRIPKDEAKKFTPKINERIRMSSAVLETLTVDLKTDGNEVLERRFLGEALVKDRNYALGV